MKTLFFKLSDFDDEEMTEREGDDFECSCDAPDVEPLGGNLFRVLAPISLTPFGPLGPGLILGQIIEAEPVSTDVWRYVRTHFKPVVRSWRVSCRKPDMLNKPDISQDLQLRRGLNCEWEWSVGNITIQRASMEGDPSYGTSLIKRGHCYSVGSWRCSARARRFGSVRDLRLAGAAM